MTESRDTWIANLTDKEMAVYREVAAWEERGGRTHRFYRTQALPCADCIRELPRAMIDSIMELIGTMLLQVCTVSARTVAAGPLMDRIAKRSGRTPGNISDIRDMAIPLLDGEARHSIRFNCGAATAEGALTGMMGFKGFMVDIPLLYGILFRMIQEVSLCYGFPIHREEERLYMLRVLELGHIPDDESRRRAIAGIAAHQAALRGTMTLSRSFIVSQAALIERLAARITGTLIRNKIALACAVLGGLTCAGLNFLFTREVADSAFFCYRKRLLMDRAARRSPSSMI